jgi:hypothetical protein
VVAVGRVKRATSTVLEAAAWAVAVSVGSLTTVVGIPMAVQSASIKVDTDSSSALGPTPSCTVRGCPAALVHPEADRVNPFAFNTARAQLSQSLSPEVVGTVVVVLD